LAFGSRRSARKAAAGFIPAFFIDRIPQIDTRQSPFDIRQSPFVIPKGIHREILGLSNIEIRIGFIQY
jgi:hypothetical protein